MKAVIPVAGVGTQLRPLTYTQPKPLIPVAGKPIVAFIIDQLKSIGVTDFVFVIGYLGEKIKAYLEKYHTDINLSFVNQDQREGSGHAIWTARELLKDSEELLIFFGDTIIDLDFNQLKDHSNSCLCIMEVEDPRQFGVVELGEDGVVSKVVEKPKIPKSNKAMVGFYKIKEVDVLLESLDYNIQNDIRTDGEFPLTDGLMKMIEKGVNFDIIEANNWFDCGKTEVLLETNEKLLNKGSYASNNLPPYDNSIIIHPVSIGKNCEIQNSIIGPHVTIGDNAKINSAIIRDSILGNYVAVDDIILQKSVIGNDTSITGAGQRLNIGDNTEIDFS